jgi:hypothetical protein
MENKKITFFFVKYYNMKLKNNFIFLGKIDQSGCCVNNGKHGYFFHVEKKKRFRNGLIEVTLDMAKRLIHITKKISEEWLEKKNDEPTN